MGWHLPPRNMRIGAAITDPAKAIDNADSHEYVAENIPFQN